MNLWSFLLVHFITLHHHSNKQCWELQAQNFTLTVTTLGVEPSSSSCLDCLPRSSGTLTARKKGLRMRNRLDV